VKAVLVSPVQDSTQATQDRGILDPFAQKVVQKPGTGFAKKFTYILNKHKVTLSLVVNTVFARYCMNCRIARANAR
jgi:hypothetical protein